MHSEPRHSLHPLFKQRQDEKNEEAEPCSFSAHHRRLISREDAMDERDEKEEDSVSRVRSKEHLQRRMLLRRGALPQRNEHAQQEQGKRYEDHDQVKNSHKKSPLYNLWLETTNNNT